MSREIKFRIWDKKNKKYRELGVYDVANGKVVVRFPIETLLKGDYILEQYTGLTDKNNKEIYEGDIVKVFSTDEYVARFEGVYRVYFDNNWLSYQMYKVQSSYSSMAEPFEPEMSINIEVIGNTHENPELLGGEDE